MTDALAPLSTPAGKRWHLRDRGLCLVAAANHLHLRNFTVAPESEAQEETSQLQQRGEAWLLQHIQHTAGVYGFFAALAQAARQQAGHTLSWWETGALCERRYRVGEQWHNLRPDALAAYHPGPKRVHFWLEWDRGTMNARDLATKFVSYAQYSDLREWAREWATMPWLVCVVPDIAQERRVQRMAQAKLSHIPVMNMWTTTQFLLKEHGPLEPIWARGILRDDQVSQPSTAFRQSIFNVIVEREVRRSDAGGKRGK